MFLTVCIAEPRLSVVGGEVVTPLNKLPKMWFVLAKPNVSVSTPKILKRLAHTEITHPNIDALLMGIESANYDQITENIGNSLEVITAASHPQIATLKRRLIEYGADGSEMSGSGPTVFGIVAQNRVLIGFTTVFPDFATKLILPSRNARRIRLFNRQTDIINNIGLPAKLKFCSSNPFYMLTAIDKNLFSSKLK